MRLLRSIMTGTARRAFVASLVPVALAAQQATGTIEGTVVDGGNRRPLQSVQVTITGTSQTIGSLTDAAGRFRINNVAAGERVVRARLIGYAPLSKTVNVQPGGIARVSFEIRPSAVQLNAVVTTGTGGSQVEARKLGSTVAAIEAPTSAPTSSLSDILQGREPGLMTMPSSGATGEGARIRVRGNASLSQSNEPIV